MAKSKKAKAKAEAMNKIRVSLAAANEIRRAKARLLKSMGSSSAGSSPDLLALAEQLSSKRQRRSAGLASYAWRAVHESERAARREACDASARIVPRAAPPRAVPTAQRSNGTARPPTMPAADVPGAQRESAGVAGVAGVARV